VGVEKFLVAPGFDAETDSVKGSHRVPLLLGRGLMMRAAKGRMQGASGRCSGGSPFC